MTWNGIDAVGFTYPLSGQAGAVDDAEAVLRADPNVTRVVRHGPHGLTYWVRPGISPLDVGCDVGKALRLLYPEKYP